MVLCVSPAAISKWERNLTYPNIEMLVALADYFNCTIDELAGRRVQQLEQIGMYEHNKLRLVEMGDILLQYCELCRREGFLALDGAQEQYKGDSRFLPFAVRFFLKNTRNGMDREAIFRLLGNYVSTLPESEQLEGRMITEALKQITAGECPEMLKELIASYVGIDYWEKLMNMDQTEKYRKSRQEIIAGYEGKAPFSHNTKILDVFEQIDDFGIQVILRNIDIATLTAALSGSSGNVITKFMSNLSDRLLIYVSEDIDRWNGTEEEIMAAQKKMLELGSCFLSKL